MIDNFEEFIQKSEAIEKKAKELEESYKNITIISEIGKKITSSLDIEKTLNIIYENINDLMDASVFGVGLYDEETKIIDYRMFIENSKRVPLFSITVDTEKSYAATCIRTRKEILLNDLPLDEDYFIPNDQADEDDKPTRSLIYYPLIIEDRIIGTITVQSYEINAYTMGDLNTLSALASYIAIALNNSQKTEELKNTAEKLSKTIEELKAAQEQLIQSEKMAALGQLISGIAHEINTPLGAIQASINNISEYAQHTIEEKIPQLFKILDQKELDLFFELLHHSMMKELTISSKDERKFKRNIRNILEEMNIDNCDSFSDTLVDMGIYDGIEKYVPLFNSENSNFIMQVSYELSGIWRNCRNIDLAVARASKMIYALKSYAHYDHTGIPVQTNVIDGIETVLSLYHNKIKHGIDLVRNYEEISAITCYPDELNQVWTNLIHNSLQAMDYKGILEIASYNIENGIAVKITDNGCGIPEDIRDKIFQPFFTTKKQGEGTGLGLEIVRKIVDKHNGKISVESLPGKTSFTIELPLNIN